MQLLLQLVALSGCVAQSLPVEVVLFVGFFAFAFSFSHLGGDQPGLLFSALWPFA